MKTIKTLYLFALWLCLGQAVQAADLRLFEEGAPTPSLKLQDLGGKLHNLSDYHGQVVLVQFWATYCPPCIKEMPSMNRLQEKMGDTPFKILAVNMGESKAEVEAFVARVKPEFTILLDPDGHSIADWQVFAAPSNFILGPEGRIRYTLFGGVEWDEDELIAQLKQLAD